MEDVVIRFEEQLARAGEGHVCGNRQVVARGQLEVAGEGGIAGDGEAAGCADVSAAGYGQRVVAGQAGVQDGQIQVTGVVDEDTAGGAVADVQVIDVGFKRIDVSAGIETNTPRRAEDGVGRIDIETSAIVVDDLAGRGQDDGVIVGDGCADDDVAIAAI